MVKDKQKKKKKGGLFKQLGIILGIVAVVVIVAIVVVNQINKTTIKYITVEGAYKELYLGNPEFDNAEIGVKVYPETASKASLIAYSSNPEIATVSFDGTNLNVQAVGVGTATITVRHASKSSLTDTMQVNVKDVDVQDLTFVSGEDNMPITACDVKKDGFEHRIPFNINPLDANMNNLNVESTKEANSAILEDVYIDKENRCLVVIPKTDIVQTSCEIDVDIYQNTIEGYRPAQTISILLNLKNREAYIKFKLSSNSRDLVNSKLNETENNLVYLERSNNANDVYVLPEIGYDKQFSTVGAFSLGDYELSFDGNLIENADFVNGEYIYKNKLKLNIANGNFYYFKTCTGFTDGDCIYVRFVHRYTGAFSCLQFIYLDVASMGLANQEFTISTSENLKTNEPTAFTCSYDIGVERGVLDIYAFKFEMVNGVRTRVEIDSFGDSVNKETIKVKKDNNKLILLPVKDSLGTTINFGVRCNYWDERYVRISNETYKPMEFVVSSDIVGIKTIIAGVETDIIRVAKGSSTEVMVEREPFGGNFDTEQITSKVTLNSVLSSQIEVLFLGDGKFSINPKSNCASGTYLVEFTYLGHTAKLFVVVS